MAKIHRGRYMAQLDDDNGDGVVVFLIGMRINQLRKVHKWMPVAREMGPMIKELMSNPDKGLLHAKTYVSGRNVMLVQYWKDAEHLERFARDRDDLHLPAWRRFNQRVGANGSVGIWHETYVVPAGGIESVYNNMPETGLAAATNHVTAGRAYATNGA